MLPASQRIDDNVVSANGRRAGLARTATVELARLGGTALSPLSDFLGDLLGDLITSGVGPSSDRGIVAMFSAISAALAIATGWLLLTSSNPIKPEWGFGVLAASLIFGGGGVLVSLLHLRRNESDRLFGALCLAVNVATVAIPLFWIIAR